MLNGPSLEELKALKLSAMAAAWEEQQKSPEHAKLAFDERLSLLVDAEWTARENARLARNLQEAKLRISSTYVEDVDYPILRKLEKGLVRQFATCRWIEEQQNVVITGAAGTGKTYIACALAGQACRKANLKFLVYANRNPPWIRADSSSRPSGLLSTV